MDVASGSGKVCCEVIVALQFVSWETFQRVEKGCNETPPVTSSFQFYVVTIGNLSETYRPCGNGEQLQCSGHLV